MPRANRHFIPGHVWHITHRCHKKEFLLKFSRDRKRWRYWLFESKKRFGLSVLNFMVTSNHIHLLVRDTGNNAIPKSMQLIAGRVAQEYNYRKKRKGAFWDDRYHATAIETDKHLIECMVYIDLNMIRAGVVTAPGEWLDCGYHEIQNPNQRYTIIDTDAWLVLLGIDDEIQFRHAHYSWVKSQFETTILQHNTIWSQSLAVGSLEFVEQVKLDLGIKTKSRNIQRSDIGYSIKEDTPAYGTDFGAIKCISSD